MTRPAIAGFILAGGRGRRFGGTDKAFIDLGGIPLIGHVIARIAPQVDRIVINANGDPSRFAAFDCPVIADEATQAGSGVFAGLAAACTWMSGLAAADALLLTTPTDTPFLPRDLAGRLAEALAAGPATIAYAASGGIAHPTVALWTRAALIALMRRIDAGDAFRLQSLMPMLGGTPVEFPFDGADPFLNVNTPGDRTAAAAALGAATTSPRSE